VAGPLGSISGPDSPPMHFQYTTPRGNGYSPCGLTSSLAVCVARPLPLAGFYSGSPSEGRAGPAPTTLIPAPATSNPYDVEKCKTAPLLRTTFGVILVFGSDVKQNQSQSYQEDYPNGHR